MEKSKVLVGIEVLGSSGLIGGFVDPCVRKSVKA